MARPSLRAGAATGHARVPAHRVARATNRASSRARLVLGLGLGLALSFGFAGCASTRAASTLPGDALDEPAVARTLLTAALEAVQVAQERLRPAAELRDAARTAHGDARLAIERERAWRGVIDAEAEADSRVARRTRADAGGAAQYAASHARDADARTQMAFVSLWLAWRTHQRRAESTASRFVAARRDNAALLYVAWTVRGEIALEQRRFDDAATAFRFVLAEPAHPLYSLALYRTAVAYRGAGRDDDATQALHSVDAAGRRADASPLAVQLARAARRELGLPDPPPDRSEPKRPRRRAGIPRSEPGHEHGLHDQFSQQTTRENASFCGPAGTRVVS